MLNAFFMAVLALAVSPTSSPAAGPDVEIILSQVGDRVREYFRRAQSLIALETVNLLPIGAEQSFSPSTRPRRLVYELRLAWEAPPTGEAPDASVMRKLLTINGRAPRPKDEPGCMDPQPVSPEPLSMLLAEHRREYIFSFAGTGKTDGRTANMLDYRSAVRGPAEVKWKDDCVSVSLPGRTRGRVWIDSSTGDVLRLDEHLVGMFEFDVPRDKAAFGPRSMAVERADSSIRYKPIEFHDPDETVLLPVSIDSFTVFRGSAVPTLHTTQTLSEYKRFLADSHIVTDPR